MCLVKAMVAYLTVRSPAPSPLFLFQDGAMLSRPCLIAAVRACLAAGGINQDCGHSFRIGAATTAVKKGIEDSMIQVLGHWQSSAYLHYVRIPGA